MLATAYRPAGPDLKLPTAGDLCRRFTTGNGDAAAAFPRRHGVTMSKKVRLNILLSAEVAAFIDDFAEQEGCTNGEVIRRGLSVLKAFKQQIAIGRTHIGFVSDPSKLDVELVGLLG